MLRHSTSVPCFLVLLLAVVTACQPAGEPSETRAAGAAVDTAAVTTALDSVRSAFAEAYSAGEFSRVSSLLHPEVIYSPAGAPPIRGRDSVTAYDQRNFPPGATLELEPIDTRVVSDEWVYELGTSTVTFTPEGADEEISLENTYLVVLRNTPEGWQLYREVSSPDQPPPGGS